MPPHLHSKLGPQGRKLYNKLSPGDATTALTHASKIMTGTLDHLFSEILRPKASTTPEEILSYLAYYYPKIRTAQNVQLLTECFLSCPLFFNDAQLIELQQSHRIIVCFTYIIDKKYQISEPTLPFYSFYRSIFAGICNVISRNSSDTWKACPVIVGCLLTTESRKEYDLYPEYYGLVREVDRKLLRLLEECLMTTSFGFGKDLQYLSLVYMASLKDRIADSTFRSILQRQPSLPSLIVDFIFNSPYGFDRGSLFSHNWNLSELSDHLPALRHLSGLSRLYCKLVSVHPIATANMKDIDISLNNIQNYCRSLFEMLERGRSLEGLDDPESDIWKLLKQCLFSLVVIFEGVALKIYRGEDTSDNSPYCSFSRKILNSFFGVSFILERVGTGGFDAYNFVYDIASDCLKQGDVQTVATLVQVWINDVHLDSRLQKSSLQQAKLLFCFNFIENNLDCLSDSVKFDTVLPLVRAQVKDGASQDVLEAAHSVMLKYFGTVDSEEESSTNWPRENTEEGKSRIKTLLLSYLSLSIGQFPSKISLGQLEIIIESLARDVFPGSTIYNWDPSICSKFQITLYQSCVESGIQDIRDTSARNAGSALKDRRAVLISLLIRITPLFTLESYVGWMDRIKRCLIDVTAEPEERKYLLDCLWDSILTANKYYPQKGSLGIEWWYKKLNDNEARL